MTEGYTRYQIIKRIFDILISLMLLVVFSPVLLLAAIMVLVLEGRPVLYVSKRLVSMEKMVSIPKFRTMVKDAKSDKYKLEERFMRDGFLDIPLTCEVYTGIGRILERTQVVELLQLLMVLRGYMSFIGNRPLPLGNANMLRKFPGWDGRFKSPAGISGISQVVGKYSLEPRERLDLERMYSQVYKHGNVVKCDLAIIYHTARLLLTGKTLPLEKAKKLLFDSMRSEESRQAMEEELNEWELDSMLQQESEK